MNRRRFLRALGLVATAAGAGISVGSRRFGEVNGVAAPALPSPPAPPTPLQAFAAAPIQAVAEQAPTKDPALRLLLTNIDPRGTDTVEEIASGNGYTAGGAPFVGKDVTWTATGGNIGPFNFVAMVDTSNRLLWCCCYGPGLVLCDGESFTLNMPSL